MGRVRNDRFSAQSSRSRGSRRIDRWTLVVVYPEHAVPGDGQLPLEGELIAIDRDTLFVFGRIRPPGLRLQRRRFCNALRHRLPDGSVTREHVGTAGYTVNTLPRNTSRCIRAGLADLREYSGIRRRTRRRPGGSPLAGRLVGSAWCVRPVPSGLGEEIDRSSLRPVATSTRPPKRDQ